MEFEAQRRRGEGHVKTEAEMGVMPPNAAECLEPWKLEEARRIDP